VSRLDRLIYRELIGVWIFGVLMFSVLIFTSLLLVRIIDWVANGVSPGVVLQLVFLLLPGIVVKTFSMAILLAGLLAFGRLSNDSEIVAIRAAGASLFRVMTPVFLFSLLVAIGTFVVNEAVVPGASYKATTLQSEIRQDLSNTKEARPIHYVVYDKENRLALYIGAKDVNIADQTLVGAFVNAYEKDGKIVYTLETDELYYNGPEDWRMRHGGRLLSWKTGDISVLTGEILPNQIMKPSMTMKNILAGIATDLDAFSIGQIWEEIQNMKRQPKPNTGQLNNLEFGFYNKIALPLSVVIFALLGAPLGIRSHRAGVASGFAISIGLSFAYLIIVNFMAVYSRAGAIPAYVASFTPVLLGVAAAAITIYKKNA
jgi:lipopolysaccharide export system permease protein